MNLTAATRIYGVIGDPVSHSLGPVMHNRAFDITGYPGVYAAFRVKDVKAAVSGIRALNIAGVSVTIPHKVSIIKHLDAVDEIAEKIGAVNTIVNTDGRLTGRNSDCDGAVRAIADHVPVNKQRVLILGAGGAARSVAFGMIQQGAGVCIANRSRKKGEALAAALGVDFCPLDQVNVESIDILINTTPVGMHPDIDNMPISPDVLHPHMLVMDIVYHPVQTRLLREAAARGCRIVDGVSMFVYQGAMQFEWWTKIPAPLEQMKQAVYAALQNK
jgi:shikimate dehydrogenase